jgi:hypothetical protein
MKRSARRAVLLLVPLAVLLAAVAAWSCQDASPLQAAKGLPPPQARSMHRSAKRLLRQYAEKKGKVPAAVWRELERCMETHRQTIRELESAYPDLAEEGRE